MSQTRETTETETTETETETARPVGTRPARRLTRMTLGLASFALRVAALVAAVTIWLIAASIDRYSNSYGSGIGSTLLVVVALLAFTVAVKGPRALLTVLRGGRLPRTRRVPLLDDEAEPAEA